MSIEKALQAISMLIDLVPKDFVEATEEVDVELDAEVKVKVEVVSTPLAVVLLGVVVIGPLVLSPVSDTLRIISMHLPLKDLSVW